MNNAVRLLFVVAFVAACQTTPSEPSRPRRVEPFGPGRFSVSYGSLFGNSTARTAAIRDANQYCGADGQVMQPVEEQAGFANFTLIFSCTASAAR
jgi:hypothetical protein